MALFRFPSAAVMIMGIILANAIVTILTNKLPLKLFIDLRPE
jgi:hypothetical protein